MKELKKQITKWSHPHKCYKTQVPQHAVPCPDIAVSPRVNSAIAIFTPVFDCCLTTKSQPKFLFTITCHFDITSDKRSLEPCLPHWKQRTRVKRRNCQRTMKKKRKIHGLLSMTCFVTIGASYARKVSRAERRRRCSWSARFCKALPLFMPLRIN